MKRSILFYLSAVLLFLLLSANRCQSDSNPEVVNGWKVWSDTTQNVNTGTVECGVESEIYTNSSRKRQDVFYRLTNNGCDVGSAYSWIVKADGSVSERTQLKNGESWRGSQELDPGDKIVFQCTEILTDDEGCTYKTRLARQKVD